MVPLGVILTNLNDIADITEDLSQYVPVKDYTVLANIQGSTFDIDDSGTLTN